MTEEDFLKRWSRRKREAEVAKPAAPETKISEADASAADNVVSKKSADAPDGEFDPATLPPIESITAVSDITAFLRAGVPVELTRAALRRVWTADPAIRDFVGLAENAWDFTDPNAMPGFGPLESTEEVRRMIARVVDQIGEATRANEDDLREPAIEMANNSDASKIEAIAPEERSASPEDEHPVVQTAELAAENLDNEVLLQSNKEDDAVQRDVTEDVNNSKQTSHRAHGGALPR